MPFINTPIQAEYFCVVTFKAPPDLYIKAMDSLYALSDLNHCFVP